MKLLRTPPRRFTTRTRFVRPFKRLNKQTPNSMDIDELYCKITSHDPLL